MTLVDFLLARIAEDEAAADLVLRPYGDHAATNDADWWRREREWFDMGLSSDETSLLTRMTPQRVLAECDAKRRIVRYAVSRGQVRNRIREPWDWWALRLIALPYSEHPDYREEWKP